MLGCVLGCKGGLDTRPHDVPVQEQVAKFWRSGMKPHMVNRDSKQFCRGNEITYHRVVTDTPVEEFMLRQLKGLLLA